jgi:hypothetical protein
MKTDSIKIFYAFLQPGQRYKLLNPTHDPSQQQLSKGYHIFIERRSYDYTIYLEFENDIVMRVEDGSEIFELGAPLASNNVIRAIRRKRTNQVVRNVYETKLGKSAEPGHGPANTIRQLLGVHPKSHRAKGLRTSRRNSVGLDWRKNNKGHWTTSRAMSPPPTENRAAGKKRKTPNSPRPNHTTRKRIVFSDSQE